MNRKLIAAIAGAVGLCFTSLATAAVVPDYVTTALTNPARPEAARARDEARHAAEILAFSGVKPGDKVGDFVIGGGYWTRIFSGIVGANGKVYAYQPAEFISFSAKYGTDLDETAKFATNIVPLKNSVLALSFPEPLDVLFTAQNYHDFHLGQMPAPIRAMMVKAMFNSLKPGGVLILIDHYAADGSGGQDASKLHRIDIALVKEEMAAAGFVLDGESDVLRNPADDRTISVFDPKIQGKTDQFVLKFRRPA